MTKSAGKPATRSGRKRPTRAGVKTTSKATAQAQRLASARSKAVVAAKAAVAAAAAAAQAIAEAELEGADVSDLVENDLEMSDDADMGDEVLAPEKSKDYLDFLSRMFDNMGGSHDDAQRYDDMSRGVGMVLGSGPAFAALESMFASTNAQSSVLMNATQTQRQLDHVGLCCTSACVKQLLNLNNSQDSD